MTKHQNYRPRKWPPTFPSLSLSTVLEEGDRRVTAYSAGDSAALLSSVDLGVVGEGRGAESPAGSVYSLARVS